MKTKILLSVILVCLTILTYGQWYTTYMATPRTTQGAASVGSKVYIAGGYTVVGASHVCMNEVEIYDVVDEEWNETVYLSAARCLPSCVSNGDLVFFAGGVDFFNNNDCFNDVDIWNSSTQEWDPLEELSIPRFDIGVVSYGNRVFFAGGSDMNQNICYNIIDIYDTESGSWSTDTLSMARAAMGATVVGDLAIFAGGYDFNEVTDRVDIYNFSEDTWSTDTLSEARGWCAALTLGNEVVIAGGMKADNTPSDRVDIYDATTGSWKTASLSFPRAVTQRFAAVVCDKAYFAGGGIYDISVNLWTSVSDVIDIYDGNNWSVDNLNLPLTNHAVAGAENYLVVAGGNYFDGFEWWIVSDVEVFEDFPCPNVTIHPQSENMFLKVYPNPLSSSTTIMFELPEPGLLNFTFVSQSGKVVDQFIYPGIAGSNNVKWDAGSLPAGIYVCRIEAGNTTGSVKMVVVR